MNPVRHHTRYRQARLAAGVALALGTLSGSCANSTSGPQERHTVALSNYGESPGVTVRIEYTDRDQAETDGHTNHPRASRIDPGTGWLIAFAFIQACVFGLQAWIGYLQIRSYLFIEDANIRRTGNDWIITYRVKNNGKSPAHKIRSCDVTAMIDWEPVGPLPTPVNNDTLGSLGPGGDFIDMSAEDVPVILTNGVAIVGETKAVLLRGRIDYCDMFKLRHHTDFCFYATGVIKHDGDQMDAWSEGNDST
jgi:hypothetical protein